MKITIESRGYRMISALGTEQEPSARASRRAHEKEMALSEHLMISTKSLGEQAVRDVYAAVRFTSGAENDPSMLDVAIGIEAELDDDERMLLAELLRQSKKLGSEGVARAFTRYSMDLEHITQLEFALAEEDVPMAIDHQS